MLRRKNNDNFQKIAFVPALKISNINISYQGNILRIIDWLHHHHILEEIFARDNIGASTNIVFDTIYQSNNNHYNYFIIPILYGEEGNNVQLLFSVNDMYLQGFLVDNNYYYFRNAQLINFPGFSATEVSETYNSIALRFSDHYRQLWTQRLQDRNISWQNIVEAFNSLRSYNNNDNQNDQVIRESLALVILVTAESLRFSRGIFQLITATIDNYRTINWHTDIQPIVNNWSTNSQT